MPPAPAPPTSPTVYRVSATRLDDSRARIESRGHELLLNVKRGSGEAGFNAAETLLAALGACLITNLTSLAAKMRLQVEGIQVQIEGLRQDDPPGIVDIRYRLELESPEPPERLQRLHEVAFDWGTVTNTLLKGTHITGSLEAREPARASSMPANPNG